jgi:phosphosulfolactate phosphohydrolase-like enzyme
MILEFLICGIILAFLLEILVILFGGDYKEFKRKCKEEREENEKIERKKREKRRFKELEVLDDLGIISKDELIELRNIREVKRRENAVKKAIRGQPIRPGNMRRR